MENDIKRNNYELNHITPPQKPQMENKASYSEDGGIMVVVVAIIALVINIYIYNCINKEVTGIFETIITGIMTLFGKYTLLVIFFIINAILFWIGFSILYDVYKYNKNIKEEYKQNMNKYGQELSDFKKNYNWIVRQYQERGAALEQQRQYLAKRRKNQEKREDYERMTVANSLVTNFILADMQRQVSDIQYRL